MFAPWMIDSWIVATIVAAMAGTVGCFVVLRGNTFEAHTVPLGAFPGAAAATLLGVDQSAGLLLFSVGAVGGITLLARRDDRQVATALSLVTLLGLGALLLSQTREYSPAVFALLFGELLGVGDRAVWPVTALGIGALGATLLLFRPLLLDTVSPVLGAARGVRPGWLQVLFLLDVALVATAALPVVGALLVFTLTVGPASAARAMTDRPGRAVALSAGLAVATVWAALALSFVSDWPVGFFVGVAGVVWYGVGKAMRGSAPRPRQALGAWTPII